MDAQDRDDGVASEKLSLGGARVSDQPNGAAPPPAPDYARTIVTAHPSLHDRFPAGTRFSTEEELGFDPIWMPPNMFYTPARLGEEE